MTLFSIVSSYLQLVTRKELHFSEELWLSAEVCMFSFFDSPFRLVEVSAEI